MSELRDGTFPCMSPNSRFRHSVLQSTFRELSRIRTKSGRKDLKRKAKVSKKTYNELKKQPAKANFAPFTVIS